MTYTVPNAATFGPFLTGGEIDPSRWNEYDAGGGSFQLIRPRPSEYAEGLWFGIKNEEKLPVSGNTISLIRQITGDSSMIEDPTTGDLVSAVSIPAVPGLALAWFLDDGDVWRLLPGYGVEQEGGGGGDPGGPDNAIQYNLGGVFSGDQGLRWDPTTETLYVGNANQGDPCEIAMGPSNAEDAVIGVYNTGGQLQQGVLFEAGPTASRGDVGVYCDSSRSVTLDPGGLQALRAFVRSNVPRVAFPESPTAGFVWTCLDGSSGEGYWAAPAGGGGDPAGPDRAVQFNDNGSFGGDADFSYTDTHLYVGANLWLGAGQSGVIRLNATTGYTEWQDGGEDKVTIDPRTALIRTYNIAGTWRTELKSDDGTGNTQDFGVLKLRDQVNNITVTAHSVSNGHLQVGPTFGDLTMLGSATRGHFAGSYQGVWPSIGSSTILLVSNHSGSANSAVITILAGWNGYSQIAAADVDSSDAGRIRYFHGADEWEVLVGNQVKVTIGDSTALQVDHDGTNLLTLNGVPTSDTQFRLNQTNTQRWLWGIDVSNANALYFRGEAGASAEWLTITQGGFVGVATGADSTPPSRLSVKSTSNSEDTFSVLYAFSDAKLVSIGQGVRGHGEVIVNDSTGAEKVAVDADYNAGKFVLKNAEGANRVWISADDVGARYFLDPISIGTTIVSTVLNVGGDYSGASPPRPGSDDNHTVRICNNNTNYGLMLGVSNSGAAWINCSRSDGNQTVYPILLNTLGGAGVGIGAKFNDGSYPIADLEVDGTIFTAKDIRGNVNNPQLCRISAASIGAENGNIYTGSNDSAFGALSTGLFNGYLAQRTDGSTGPGYAFVALSDANSILWGVGWDGIPDAQDQRFEGVSLTNRELLKVLARVLHKLVPGVPGNPDPGDVAQLLNAIGEL